MKIFINKVRAKPDYIRIYQIVPARIKTSFIFYEFLSVFIGSDSDEDEYEPPKKSLLREFYVGEEEYVRFPE